MKTIQNLVFLYLMVIRDMVNPVPESVNKAFIITIIKIKTKQNYCHWYNDDC